jgi:hypothetical protein
MKAIALFPQPVNPKEFLAIMGKAMDEYRPAEGFPRVVEKLVAG